jgi:hypothetical protein
MMNEDWNEIDNARFYVKQMLDDGLIASNIMTFAVIQFHHNFSL